MEEAVVENLCGVIVDELGADLLQVITGVDELMRGMGLADIESRVRALGGTAVCGPYEDVSVLGVDYGKLYYCFRPLSRYIGLYPHILCPRQLFETQDVGPTGNSIYIVPYDCRPIKA